MARIRTVKPEIWTDPKFVALSHPARLLFMGMWNFADDCGHIEDEPLRLKLQILPADDVDAQAIVDELVASGLIDRLSGCLFVKGFSKHQKIDKRSVCRFDESQLIPPEPTEARLIPPSPPESQLRKGREGNGGEVKPSSTDVDLEGFEDFWNLYPRRKGKRIGKGPAQTVWKRLNKRKREMVMVAVRHYAEACNRGDTLARDPQRFLSNKDGIVEEYQTPAEVSSPNGRPPETSQYRTPEEIGL